MSTSSWYCIVMVLAMEIAHASAGRVVLKDSVGSSGSGSVSATAPSASLPGALGSLPGAGLFGSLPSLGSLPVAGPKGSLPLPSLGNLPAAGPKGSLPLPSVGTLPGAKGSLPALGPSGSLPSVGSLPGAKGGLPALGPSGSLPRGPGGSVNCVVSGSGGVGSGSVSAGCQGGIGSHP